MQHSQLFVEETFGDTQFSICYYRLYFYNMFFFIKALDCKHVNGNLIIWTRVTFIFNNRLSAHTM